MSEQGQSIPTGRVRRTAKIGGLLGTEVARAYATKVANLVRSDEDRDAANGRRRMEADEHMVDVLGEMKGAAMKLGQMASIIDLAWELMKNESMPSDSRFSNRMQGMTLAAIGQLRATGNWHRIMLEWLYGATPFSSLGLAVAEFFGAHRARAA